MHIMRKQIEETLADHIAVMLQIWSNRLSDICGRGFVQSSEVHASLELADMFVALLLAMELHDIPERRQGSQANAENATKLSLLRYLSGVVAS